MAIVLVVYVDRDGYRDVTEEPLSLLDCAYYAVVTLSTTGYGDITPLTPTARLINVLIITPARVLFLIILVGTTLEVLTEQYRGNLRLTRWRQKVKDHVIVCGYGTKGRSAVRALLENGQDKDRIVVVEQNAAAMRAAVADGLVAVGGLRHPLGDPAAGPRQDRQGGHHRDPLRRRGGAGDADRTAAHGGAGADHRGGP